MSLTLDIFNDDAFSLTSLTKAISSTPYKPGRIGKLGLFSEEPVNTLHVMIERVGTTLNLVKSEPRNAPGAVVTDDKRNMVPISLVHLPQRGAVMADEVQGIRAFGTETSVEAVSAVVNRILAKKRANIDVTIEYQRIGAIKGIVYDSNGSSVLLSMWNTFGVTQIVQSFDLDVDTTDVRQKIVALKRAVEAELGGLSYSGIRVFCSAQFFDDLVSHPMVAAAFDRWNAGSQLRDDLRDGFPMAGVVFEEYRGGVGSDFIESGAAYAVPEGVSDLFVTNYGPANYMETVNTMGLPYYAKQERMKFDKGVEIECQSNPISYCTRPRAVVKLTNT